MIYLAVGFAIGPAGLSILQPRIPLHAALLERIVEIALLISLFSAGLKLRLPFSDVRWRFSLRLATLSMLIAIALIASICLLLGFSFGAALLIGAALAPTDPVLAADVQVENSSDRDLLRFSLTGESSLNDGIAQPFVLLALLCLTAEPPSQYLWHWFSIDLLWAVLGGAATGAVCGVLLGRLVLYLRTRQKEAIGLDEFLVLGLISLAYGVAVLCRASPFLAVFCAGLAVCHTAREAMTPIPAYAVEKLDELASHPQHAAPMMMRALRDFNEQLERIAEVAIVILVGAMLSTVSASFDAIAIMSFTFLVARPLSVRLALLHARITGVQRWLISWFGVRGIGSIYYALYAINHGLLPQLWEPVLQIILVTVAGSIFIHGISVTPLMNYYATVKLRTQKKK
jgi:NhaP-type Na+/H+ or K+/H+ antiporter